METCVDVPTGRLEREIVAMGITSGYCNKFRLNVKNSVTTAAKLIIVPTGFAYALPSPARLPARG